MIAAKDAADVLGAALSALAGQSLAPWEVVVVDDGSQDNTASVAEAWRDRLPVKVLRLPRSGGPGRARHLGVERTSAPLVSFLDADDVVLPSHLADLCAVHAERGGIVSPDGLFWFPGRGVDTSRYRDERPVAAPHGQIREILRHNFLTIASLVGRDDYDAVGGFRGDFDGAEDWDLWMRLIRSGVHVHGTGASYVYRQSLGSCSRESRAAAASLSLIDAVLPELDGDERVVALRTRRAWRGKLVTARALEHARQGRWAAARRTAVPAVACRDRSSVRAAAIVVSPRRAAVLAELRAQRLWGVSVQKDAGTRA